MQESKRHHYVPQFYLRQWNADCGQVLVVRKIGNGVVRKRHAAKYTGFDTFLYSYHEDFDAKDRSEMETKFFKPLDDAGARIMSDMIARRQLEKKDRILWAQFIALMIARTPNSVARIRSSGREFLVCEMESIQSEYSALKSSSAPDTPIDWLEVNNPGLLDSFGLMQMPKIALKPMQAVISFNWYTVDFENSSKVLLSSDRPCVMTEGLDHANCVIALPLSPRHAFFAFRSNSNARQGLMNAPLSRLALRLNESVVGQAAQQAYCQNSFDAPDSFFRRCLSAYQ